MDLPKVIGWGVVALIGYYVMQAIMPVFLWGLVGLTLWYCYLQYEEHNRRK
jgi:hypothetical protein